MFKTLPILWLCREVNGDNGRAEMTTSELIEKLYRLDPTGQKRVEISVGVYTKAYPVAYVSPVSVDAMAGPVRINCGLPEGMSIAIRKSA